MVLNLCHKMQQLPTTKIYLKAFLIIFENFKTTTLLIKYLPLVPVIYYGL